MNYIFIGVYLFNVMNFVIFSITLVNLDMLFFFLLSNKVEMTYNFKTERVEVCVVVRCIIVAGGFSTTFKI